MYFDPGTGSMIIQLIIATVAGAGAFFFTFKTNVTSFVKRVFKKEKKQNDNEKK